MKSLSRKTSSKLFPLTRVTPFANFEKRKLAMNAFTKSINALHVLNEIKNPIERLLLLI